MGPAARTSKATNIAHRTQKHGDVETYDTTVHPQQGTAETGITSAPENCTKNAHFSPAKAMTVSIPHKRKRAKAIAVSDHRAISPAAPTRGTRGRWRGLAGQRAEPQPYISTPGPTGAEGAGGTGRPGCDAHGRRLATTPMGGDDTTARQISHVIYLGHFSRHPKNVAIPTMPIQSLKG